MKLDETFLFREAGPPPVPPGVARSNPRSARLKPELEKVLQQHVQTIAAKAQGGRPLNPVVLADLLRNFAHDLEGAEGEDPKELDPDGPPAGSTGKKG